MSRQRSIITTAVVAIAAIAAGMLLARAIFDRGRTADLGLAKATLVTPARPLPAFALTDQDGASFEAARLKGHWTLMFFGFTHCPDVCPTTLGMLAQVEKQLAATAPAASPQVVLVSVDPQRDTPAQLKSYVKFFSPTFTGVTGSVPAINDFTRALGVPTATTQLGNGNYTVDHSAVIFLLDPNGSMRAVFSTPYLADVIAADYRRIVSAQ